MTKWEYKIVEIWFSLSHESEHVMSVHIDGVEVNPEQKAKWSNTDWQGVGRRHEVLNELGKEGWELIKTRSKFQNKLEVLYFKRPL